MKQQLNYSSLEEHLHNPGNGLGDIYEVPVSIFIKEFQLTGFSRAYNKYLSFYT